jgi:hypothetical protein
MRKAWHITSPGQGRVGLIWSFGDDQELRNMFTRTAQPGLWFIASSFAQCRIYSKYLGLQIKACEVGLLPQARVGSDAPSNVLVSLGSAGFAPRRILSTNTAARRHMSRTSGP